MLLPRARLLVATLWAGSLWTVGYLVAPTLFAALDDRALAGTIVGHMLRSEAWLSIACAALMLVLLRMSTQMDAKRRRSANRLVVAMLACTLAVYLGLQPMMAALREAAGPGGVMESTARTQFGILHGVSQLIYVIQSLLAGFLVVKNA
jgi:hypothetical protein